MQIAHVILVHKNPHSICRLINRLSNPNTDCWIHVDKKHDTPDFRKILSKENPIFIEPNLNVDWGCYNTVEAMLLAIQKILDTEKKYDYINFMSGQDYPLQPSINFLNYLQANNGYEFIGNRPLEESKQNIVRFNKYYLNDYSFFGKKLFERIINKILPDRKFPNNFEIRKGPQWMTITRNAAQYVLEFVATNPQVVDYFRTIQVPDEFFFQTILYNSPFRDKLKNQFFHYIDWSEGKSNPKILTTLDYEKIINNTSLFFARKFDTDVDTKILDLLDNDITIIKTIKSEEEIIT